VQQQLLRTLLDQGDAALHRAVQAVWPLDPEAAFGRSPRRSGSTPIPGSPDGDRNRAD